MLSLNLRSILGRALTWAEGDANWSAIQTAVNGLLAASPGVGIASIDQPTSGTIRITLTNAATATFALPMGSYNYRGTWAASTAYAVNDTFQQNGSLYVVLLAHTSASSFDAGANDGSGHDYYQALLAAPAATLPTGGTTGQALVKNSNSDFDTKWDKVALAAGGTGVDASALTQNKVLASPNGSTGAAAFRALVGADLPPLISAALSAATGTVPFDPTTADIATVTPTGALTVNASTTPAKRLTFKVTTSGTTSYNITFGTNFKSQGALATGTTSGAVFTVDFVGDGSTFTEVSRTAAM